MRENKNADLLGGIWNDNPLFRMMLGLCPALAITTTAFNSLYMGIVTACVLILTNLIVSLMRPIMPEKGHLPVVMAISAIFTTIARMFIRAHIPGLAESLGIFLPLVAVNVLILDWADVFATQSTPFAAVNDGLVMGLGYTCALVGIGIVREILGYGTVFGVEVLSKAFNLLIVTTPVGGFIIVGLLMGIGNAIVRKLSKDEEGESA